MHATLGVDKVTCEYLCNRLYMTRTWLGKAHASLTSLTDTHYLGVSGKIWQLVPYGVEESGWQSDYIANTRWAPICLDTLILYFRPMVAVAP